MQSNRHLQRHRLHRQHSTTTAAPAMELKKRQSDWDRFTGGVKDAIDFMNPFKPPPPKTTESTPAPTKSPPAPTRAPAKDEDDDERTTKPTPKTTTSPTTSATPKATTTTVARITSSSSPPPSSKVGLPASVVPTETSASISETTLAVATDKPTVPLESAAATSVSPAQSSASLANANSRNADQEASSTAAKAGIAFGVIGGVLILGLVIWFIIRKRKQQMERQRLDDERFSDEKFNRDFAAESASHAPAAPLAAGAIAADSRPRTAASGTDKQLPVFPKNTDSAWERPSTGNSANPSNPFGNHAEKLETRPVSPLSDIGVASSTAPVSPVLGASGPAVAGAAVAGGVVGAAAAAALTRKQSLRKDLPRPPDLTVNNHAAAVPMAQPTGGAASPGAAAIAAAGGPQASAVHRVQLDFHPTMEDELELKAGDLVRLLFEYDDGWALCIRLDRSKQGVVPRTCLSVRPVKPRPGPGGPGPQQQPGMGRGPGSIGRKPVPGQAY